MSALKRRLDKIDGSRGAAKMEQVVVGQCPGETDADVERKITAKMIAAGRSADDRDNVLVIYGAWMQLSNLESRASL